MQQLSLLPTPSQASGDRPLQDKRPERGSNESFKASLSKAGRGFESGSVLREEQAASVHVAEGRSVNATSDVTRNSSAIDGAKNKPASLGMSESGAVLPVESQSLPYRLSSGSVSPEAAGGLVAGSDVDMGSQSEAAIEPSSDQLGQGLSPIFNGNSNDERSLLTGLSPSTRSTSEAGLDNQLYAGDIGSKAPPQVTASIGLGSDQPSRDGVYAGENFSNRNKSDAPSSSFLEIPKSAVSSVDSSNDFNKAQDGRPLGRIDLSINNVRSESIQSTTETASAGPNVSGSKSFETNGLVETRGLGVVKDSELALSKAAYPDTNALSTPGAVAASLGLTKDKVSLSGESNDARVNQSLDQQRSLDAQLRPPVKSLGVNATSDVSATGVDSLDLDASFKSILDGDQQRSLVAQLRPPVNSLGVNVTSDVSAIGVDSLDLDASFKSILEGAAISKQVTSNDASDVAAAKLEQVGLAPKLVDGPKAAEPSQRPYVSSLGLPVTDNEWANQLSQKLMWMSAKNIQSAELHLNPADMGPIDIKIQVGADQSTINFNTPNQSVRELLEANIHRLRDMLNAQADNNSAEQILSNNGQSQSNNNNGSSNESSHQELSGVGSSPGELSSSESQLVTASKQSVSDSAVDTYV